MAEGRQQPGDDTGDTPERDPVDRAPAWSGRAGVPPPAPPPTAAGQSEWGYYYDDQPGRRWWMPILVGLVALLLLGVLIFGVWLIIRSTDDTPAPTTGSPSVSPSSVTSRPTSAASRTPVPTPSAPTAPTVPMPPLVGLAEAQARELLDQLGIDYRLRYRSSDRPAGTVLESEPGAGEPVSAGDQVTLVVAEEPEPAPGTTGPSPSTDPGPNGRPTPAG